MFRRASLKLAAIQTKEKSVEELIDEEVWPHLSVM